MYFEKLTKKRGREILKSHGKNNKVEIDGIIGKIYSYRITGIWQIVLINKTICIAKAGETNGIAFETFHKIDFHLLLKDPKMIIKKKRFNNLNK